MIFLLADFASSRDTSGFPPDFVRKKYPRFYEKCNTIARLSWAGLLLPLAVVLGKVLGKWLAS